MRRLTEVEARLFLEPNVGWLEAMRPDATPELTVVWVDYDGEHVACNVTEARAKLRYLRRNPFAVVAVYDRDDPYRWVRVEGTFVELTHDGAREHVDALHRKYRGGDTYPLPEGEQRVIARLRPERVLAKL